MKKGHYGTKAIKKVFLAIAVFNFLNMILHFVSYYKPIVFTEFDYGLYVFKIALYFFVYKFLKKNSDKAFHIVINKLLLATMVLDAIELYVSVWGSTLKSIPYCLMLLILFKFIIDCLLYVELIYIATVEKSYKDRDVKDKSGAKKFIGSWSVINLFVLFFIIAAYCGRNIILLFVAYILLFVRFLVELMMIGTAMKDINTFCGPKQIVVDSSFAGKIHNTYREDKYRRYKTIVGIICASVLSLLLMCGIFRHYAVDNEKYVELNDDVTIKVPLIVRLTASKRQHILRDYTYNCWDYLEKRDFQNIDHEVSAEFRNGVITFYSDFYDGYGLLRQDGTVVLKPVYDELKILTNNGLVHFHKQSGELGIINANGDVLISDHDGGFSNKYEDYSVFHGGVVLYTNSQEFYSPENGKEELYHLMDQNGNEMEGLYSATHNDAIHKYTGEANKKDQYRLLVPGEYTTLLVIDGKILLESDKYDDFIVNKDRDTGEVTEIVGITKSGEEEKLGLDIIK